MNLHSSSLSDANSVGQSWPGRACLAHPHWLTDSDRLEHIPFAFTLIDVLRPRSIVEIGVDDDGALLAAFAQAADALSLETGMTAIHFHNTIEPAARRRHLEMHYPGRVNAIVRPLTDINSQLFPADSVDLLHILPTQKAEELDQLLADCKVWLSGRAVILRRPFRSEIVSAKNMFLFTHGGGLVVQVHGAHPPPSFVAWLDWAHHNSKVAQWLYARLGQRLTLINTAEQLSTKLAETRTQARSDTARLHGLLAIQEQATFMAEYEAERVRAELAEIRASFTFRTAARMARVLAPFQKLWRRIRGGA